MHLRSEIQDPSARSGFDRSAPLTKSDFAHNELRRRIVTGELMPGARLDLQELCDALGISRMPMREALSRLSAQGLIEIHPQRATVVSELSVPDLRDTYGARVALETLLAESATPYVDDELMRAFEANIDEQRRLASDGDLEGFLFSDRRFHDRLYERAAMPRTHGLATRLRDVADRYVYLFLRDGSHRQQSIDEHVRLVALCGERDAVAVRNAVGEHIMRGRDELLEQLKRAGS
ncbi:GntR family transcriptional regulator [Candidatus Solirubrobacter pratensis]|uniref:GntR family transcriptional regulator n=1 Tax=Candidatus Solirubrobacter pratensis TaxID=1298857 RepID=UPI000402ECAF|nr:GntR family transcriptional regulator [Candidatus Solirubrobacter pratensis]